MSECSLFSIPCPVFIIYRHFVKAILISVRWYLIVVLICISVILWPPHVKSWLIGKDSDAGRDWGQEKKGTTEDEMAGWHHWLDGHEFEWTPGAYDGQGGLECYGSWGRKESDTTDSMADIHSVHQTLWHIRANHRILFFHTFVVRYGHWTSFGSWNMKGSDMSLCWGAFKI